MNGLFLTQSSSLRLFYSLMQELEGPLDLNRAGFLVAYRRVFESFRREMPALDSGRHIVVKEWEITGRGLSGSPDLARLRRFGNELGTQLQGGLIADRRLYYGGRATFTQDYRSRFSHRQLLGVLDSALVAMEQTFDVLKPDFVAGFICVTLCEYVAYLFARSRGIPVINLRPTRVKNYVVLGESMFEPSERVRAAYMKYLVTTGRDQWTAEASDYVKSAAARTNLYEGVVRSPAGPGSVARRVRSLPWNLTGALLGELRLGIRSLPDIHDPGILVPSVYKQVINPVRSWLQRHAARLRLLRREDLARLDYAFFPLHLEPENTLLVFSRHYLNQIEVVRSLSHSLPLGTTLVVKEHPLAMGRRPTSYYRKLLAIPGVRLAEPTLVSTHVIAHARLVATIAGSIGWEAVLARKPVVTFGRTPYEILPRCMVRRVNDLETLADEISDLLTGYEYREADVISYVAAIMSQSAPVNLYSTLLGRSSAYAMDRGDPGSAEASRADIRTLAAAVVRTVGGHNRVREGRPAGHRMP